MQGYFGWVHPYALNLLWLAPFLAAIVWLAASRRQRALRIFLGARYEPADWRWHRRLRLVRGLLLVAALSLLAVALARPRLGTEVQKTKRHGLDVVFVIDTSDSMMAQDVRPSRIEAAKEAAISLVNRLQGDRIGIVVFAGSAYMYSPLTIDTDAAAMFISSIQKGSAPAPGTALGGALGSALRLLEKAQYKHKAIVLFSDGEDHPGVDLQNLKVARERGVRLHVVGLGTEEGGPIPVEEVQGKPDPNDPMGLFESVFGGEQPREVKSTLKRDKNGEIVLTKLNRKMLGDVAREGGGVLVTGSESGTNIDRVYAALAAMEAGASGSYEFTRYAERFQWPLAGALLLLAAHLLMPAAPRRRREERADA